MEKDESLYTSGEIIRPAIMYLLMRKNELTAREIQSRLGLKRQTTYNYLKELEEKGWIKIEYRQHKTKPHMNVGYYSRAKHEKKEATGKKKKKELIYPAEQYIKSLDEGVSLEEDCKYCSGNVRDTIIEQINFGIAALSEKKKIIREMSDEDIKQFLKNNRKFPGPIVQWFLLTNDEFEEFGRELKDLYERAINRWLVEEGHKGHHDEDLFLISLFKE